ncbi:sugar phosphate isomerase/epimerase family protein [Dasania marina]|uniref:sugar phosphate isomerase/epimerase family protein n=1 Tax=Dasania marina TaxID=471499 RepID=UPI0003739D81|nr:sugar phosphate isomerase/epimerase [Dasania marina]
MQKLEVFQSLWAMEQRHPEKPERSLEESFAMIAEAGYHGVCLDLDAEGIDDALQSKPLFDKYNLKAMANGFPSKMKDMKTIIATAKEFNCVTLNIISGVMPVSVAGAIPVIYRWMEEAEQAGMPLTFETHREGILNDLYYTLEVIDAIPELRICADLSHFVLDREFVAPISSRDQGYINRVMDRADSFQGRIASREQIQVQIDFPQHQQWVEIFKGWWKDGMREWRKRNPNDATLIFLCELGPPPYAITDANQLELSDRWQEALTIKSWAEDIWQELEQEDA